jgi:hypothetical protein
MAVLANAVTVSRIGFGAAGPALFSGHARGRSGFCAKTFAQTGQDIVGIGSSLRRAHGSAIPSGGVNRLPRRYLIDP